MMKYLVLVLFLVATGLSAHEKVTEAQAKEIFELWLMDLGTAQIIGGINEAVQAQKVQREMMPGLYAGRYESLSDKELGKYVEFLESKSGKNLNEVYYEATLAAMSDGFTQALDIIISEVKKNKN